MLGVGVRRDPLGRFDVMVRDLRAKRSPAEPGEKGYGCFSVPGILMAENYPVVNIILDFTLNYYFKISLIYNNLLARLCLPNGAVA